MDVEIGTHNWSGQCVLIFSWGGFELWFVEDNVEVFGKRWIGGVLIGKVVKSIGVGIQASGITKTLGVAGMGGGFEGFRIERCWLGIGFIQFGRKPGEGWTGQKKGQDV
jgi:hypothetical protein